MRLIPTLGAMAGLASVTLSCRTFAPAGDSTPLATEARNFDDELGMRPGVGYDALAGDVRGDCIDHDGAQPPGTSQEAIFSLKIIESHSQLSSALGISSETQVKSGYVGCHGPNLRGRRASA